MNKSKKTEMAGKMKGHPTDAQMQKEIKANAKRIASNPNHPVMQMERDHAAGMRHD